MATAAKKPCAKFGCLHFAPMGKKYCEEKHSNLEAPKFRTAATAQLTTCQRGYDYRWKKFRKAILARDPFCVIGVVCVQQRGAPVPSTCVDHIVPIERAPELRLDPANTQGSCDACNDWKNREFDRKGLVYAPGISNRSNVDERPIEQLQRHPRKNRE